MNQDYPHPLYQLIQVIEAQFGSLLKLLKHLFRHLFNVHSEELKRKEGVKLNCLLQR
jgi:hypothetical protein